MNATLTTPIGQLVLERPETLRYFEDLGLDYCCGGHRSLAEACASAHREPAEVLAGLARLEAPQAGLPALRDWSRAPLANLIQHILDTHHAYLREVLPRMQTLLGKVVGAHGEGHPELAEVERLFQALAADLGPHLLKEEQILFPFILQMERGEPGSACFGTVQSPIRVMEMEHEAVGAVLAELKQLTSAYAVPADGCASFRALYEGLAALERDLHLHIYLENQILHPRATAMESAR